MTEAFDLVNERDDGWKVENDQQADWAIQKIKAANAELDKWTRYYNLMIQRVKDSTDRTVAYMTAALEEYFRTVPHKETKTQEKYSLPGGDLVLKKPKTVWNHDDDALMRWCESNGLSECIKVKKSISWADIKKRLTEDSNGTICDSETGLVCDGVTVSTEEARFVVNVNE